MIENTNTRNIILAILGVVIIIGGVYYFTSNKSEDINIDKQNQVQKIEVKEFGELTDFVKPNLSVSEKEELNIILEQRKDRLLMIKDILDEAYNKGEMEEAWIEVAGMREKCKGRILPFIAESQVEAFNQYCSQAAEEVDSNYIMK